MSLINVLNGWRRLSCLICDCLWLCRKSNAPCKPYCQKLIDILCIIISCFCVSAKVQVLCLYIYLHMPVLIFPPSSIHTFASFISYLFLSSLCSHQLFGNQRECWILWRAIKSFWQAVLLSWCFSLLSDLSCVNDSVSLCVCRIDHQCPRGWWGSPTCGPCHCDTNKGFDPDCNKTSGQCQCKVTRRNTQSTYNDVVKGSRNTFFPSGCVGFLWIFLP